MSHQVESHHRVGRDVRGLIVKSTVHVNCLIDCPNGVSESLSRLELFPLTVLSFIDLHENLLTDGIGSATKDNHESSDKDS